MTFQVHVDSPRGIQLYNLSQELTGWVTADAPIDVNRIRVLIDDAPANVQFFPRPDVESLFGSGSAAGWLVYLDRKALLGPRRTLAFSFRYGDQEYRRLFLKSRHLMPDANRSPIFFMHIPKTAGTSLRHFVDYAFGDFPSLAIYDEYPGILEEEALQNFKAFTQSREIIFGHFAFDFVRRVHFHRPKVVTTFRDPAETIRSYVNFHKNPDPRFLDNPLVRYVSGMAYELPAGAIGEQHLELALYVARRFLHVIRSASLQAFADDFCATFAVPRFDIPIANKSPNNAEANVPFNVDFDNVLYRACTSEPADFVEFLNR